MTLRTCITNFPINYRNYYNIVDIQIIYNLTQSNPALVRGDKRVILANITNILF